MKKKIKASAITLVIILASISFSKAQIEAGQIFAKGDKASAAHVTGDAWAKQLVAADTTYNVQVLDAIFAPKARTHWLIHPGGQIILVTGGSGYYQEKGKVKQILHKGDAIKCAPGVEHWLGATPDESLYTVNITTNPHKGGLVVLEEVTAIEYNK